MAKGLQYAALKGAKRLTRLRKNIPKMREEKLHDVGRYVIEQWYESYDPIFYDDGLRGGGLFGAYNITVNKNADWHVRFSPNGMLQYNNQYHQDARIIYNNAFILGYHGGSLGKGVNDTEPHWRTPFPYFSEWGYKAVRTFSPRDVMVNRMTKEMDKIDAYISSEIESVIDDIVKEM